MGSGPLFSLNAIGFHKGMVPNRLKNRITGLVWKGTVIVPNKDCEQSFMNMNAEKVKRWAKDLRKQEPRPPSEELGGFELAARCVDKCRAALLGWQGEYQYRLRDGS